MRGDINDVWDVIGKVREDLHSLDRRLVTAEGDIKTIRETHLINICDQLRETDARLSSSIKEVSVSQKEMRAEIKLLLKEATDKLAQDVSNLVAEHNRARGAIGVARYIPVLLSGVLGAVVSAITVYSFFGG